MWADLLIAARTRGKARLLLLDRYDAREFRSSDIRPYDGMIEYCNDDGEVVGEVDGANVESVWPNECIVTEF
jgi:hypothetical protein